LRRIRRQQGLALEVGSPEVFEGEEGYFVVDQSNGGPIRRGEGMGVVEEGYGVASVFSDRVEDELAEAQVEVEGEGEVGEDGLERLFNFDD